MPNGKIQREFTDTLLRVGAWLQQYGQSIYGTRGNLVAPQPWGVITAKEKTLFVHVLNKPEESYLFIPMRSQKPVKAFLMKEHKPLRIKQQAEGLFVFLDGVVLDDIDTVIQLETN